MLRISIKSICLLGVIFCCFFGCNKSIEEIDLLNMTAPNGEKISENVFKLKDEISSILKNSHNISEDFEITNLKYLPVAKGYFVFIEYQTSSGIKGNIVKAKDTNVKHFSKVITLNVPRLKSQSEDTGGGVDNIVFSCNPRGSCSSCIVEGEMWEGGATAYCSCSECELKVHIY